MGGKTEGVAGCLSPGFLRELGVGRGHKVRTRETEAQALALRHRKGGKRDGEKEGTSPRGDGPTPSLAGRVFRISGMLGMGLLP